MTFKVNEGQAVKCSRAQTTIYRYTSNQLRPYPNPAVAASWDSNWLSFKVIDCIGILYGPIMAFKGDEGQAVKCSKSQSSIYRYTDNELRLYPNPAIANSWDSNWLSFKVIDCTGIPKGPAMTFRVNGCYGYFCNKYVHTMFIFMTHNSFAVPFKVASPNQNYGMATQFKDGIRGFSLDVYNKSNGKIYMKHGDLGLPDYGSNVRSIVEELEKSKNKYEFVLVQFENKLDKDMNFIADTLIPNLLEPWGQYVITNFDPNTRLDEYINMGKRVLLVTDGWENSLRPDKGIHSTTDFITENNYKWFSSAISPPYDFRRGPQRDWTSIKLMNYFCGTWPGLGSMVSSAIVNHKGRMLFHAREFKRQAYAMNQINVMMVDYYDTGNIWPTQVAIRADDFNSGCWGDGAYCGIGTTCWNCCNKYTYWKSRLFTMCGKEP